MSSGPAPWRLVAFGLLSAGCFAVEEPPLDAPRYAPGSPDRRLGVQLLLKWDSTRGFGVGAESFATIESHDFFLGACVYPRRPALETWLRYVGRLDPAYVKAECLFVLPSLFLRTELESGLGWPDLATAGAFLRWSPQSPVGVVRTGLRVKAAVAWLASAELSLFARKPFVGAWELASSSDFSLLGWHDLTEAGPDDRRSQFRFEVVPIGVESRIRGTRSESSAIGVVADFQKLGLFALDRRRFPWMGLSGLAGRGPSWHHERNVWQDGKGPADLAAMRQWAADGRGSVFSEDSVFHRRQIEFRMSDSGRPLSGFQFVYDAGTGRMDVSRTGGGTFDIIGPLNPDGTWNFWRIVGHGIVDLFPYLIWGN